MSTKLTEIVADFDTQLSTKVIATDTTFSISSITDDDGNTIPNGEYCFTVNDGNSNKEYLVGTVTGTAVTAVKTVTRQGVQASGATQTHRIGSSVKITNFLNMFQQLRCQSNRATRTRRQMESHSWTNTLGPIRLRWKRIECCFGVHNPRRW